MSGSPMFLAALNFQSNWTSQRLTGSFVQHRRMHQAAKWGCKAESNYKNLFSVTWQIQRLSFSCSSLLQTYFLFLFQKAFNLHFILRQQFAIPRIYIQQFTIHRMYIQQFAIHNIHSEIEAHWYIFPTYVCRLSWCLALCTVFIFFFALHVTAAIACACTTPAAWKHPSLLLINLHIFSFSDASWIMRHIFVPCCSGLGRLVRVKHWVR